LSVPFFLRMCPMPAPKSAARRPLEAADDDLAPPRLEHPQGAARDWPRFAAVLAQHEADVLSSPNIPRRLGSAAAHRAGPIGYVTRPADPPAGGNGVLIAARSRSTTADGRRAVPDPWHGAGLFRCAAHLRHYMPNL